MPRVSAIPHIAANIASRRCRSLPQAASTFREYATPRARTSTSQGASLRLPSRPPPREYQPKNPVAHDLKATNRSPTTYLWGVSIFGVVLGIYLSSLALAQYRTVKKNAEIDLEQNADVSHRWNDRSRNYDYEVDSQESIMLLRKKRERLIKEAQGKVLEVSVGTGRNMELYDLRPYDAKEEEKYGRSRDNIISSLVFNDQSEVMVEQASNKFIESELRKYDDEKFTGDVTFVIGDAGVPGVIDRPAGGFDTIIQTFGICSMAKPVEFLQTLGKLCRQPGEGAGQTSVEEQQPDLGGRILLLEHGHGHYQWLNDRMDKQAKVHALHYGCWFNKDIDQVIQESGLRVERIRQYHLGTTWEVILRPQNTRPFAPVD